MNDSWWMVVSRDGGLCQDCGALGTAVHHIIHRNKHNPKLDQPKNLILLCEECHSKANATAAKIRQLLYLQGKYGYTYDEQPWSGLIALGQADGQ